MKNPLDKPTPTVNELAKKYDVSVLEVKKQLLKGIKVEKEHTNNAKIAREIALDHLGEKLNYYTLLSKIDEESGVTGVDGIRGLGYTSGNPSVVNYVDDYINTNALSYEDENGNKLDYIKKSHNDLHNKNLRFKAFDPTKIGASKNFEHLHEGKKFDKAKKTAMAGLTAANLYTLGDVAGRAASGEGNPKHDVVAAASTLPGTAGWAATAAHYARKAYEKMHNEDKDPCWKGYEMVGMKNKKGRKVPNCVPVEEDWQDVNRKDKTDGLSQKAVDAYRRENPGSHLQTAVTEKNPTGKRAARRKSFCSRMSGMKKRLTSAKTARDPDSRINKALRRWNCHEETINELKAETLGSYIKKASESRKKSLEGSKPNVKTWGKRQKGINTAIKQLTKECSKDKDWDAAAGFSEQQEHLHLNKPDTKYAPGASGITHTVHEETKMDNQLINEAIESIIENDLSTMKENLMIALQEKAMEKLEERKKQIASDYFAQ